MRPIQTIYRVLTTPADYRKAHAFLVGEGREAPLGWPTVVAEREKTILGLFGTTPSKDAVIAGPMVLADGLRHGIVYMRLIEAYEVVLRHAGVRSYLFWIASGDSMAAYRRLVEKFGVRPYATQNGRIWYHKEVTGHGRRE